MTFRDFVELTRDALESVAFGLEGNRDITPMLHLESPVGGLGTWPIDGWFLSSAEGMQLFCERFAIPLIKQDRANKVAWTFCAWSAPDDGEARPSEHDERREILLATFIDPEVVEHWAAPIVRTGGPVVIGNWTPSLPNVGGGPLITAIQEALR